MNDVRRNGRRRRSGRLALALALVFAVAAPLAGATGDPVVFGDSIPLNGEMPGVPAGQSVDILAREYGHKGFGRIATVRTRAGGRWTYVVRPRILTTYVATTTGSLTSSIDIHVAPWLDLDLRRGILSVEARTLNRLRGHHAFVQVRRPGGTWRSVRKVVLGPGARASLPFEAPQGLSEIRIFMPKSQAGAGYDAGLSGILVFRNSA